MIWLERWRALAARIDGLVRAGELMASIARSGSGNEMKIGEKSFTPNLQAVTAELRALEQAADASIPTAAREALKRYLGQGWDQMNFGTISSADVMATKVLVPLAAFRSEFEHLLQDHEAEARSTVELAFEHLKRLIVVDDQVRKKWQAGFAQHETRCEKLGAVHLLSHGIWAFKVAAVGAATDLVFPEPIDARAPAIERTARALVLTEWKMVRDRKDLATKAAEARGQAELYRSGALGGAEVKSTRYVVLVTGQEVAAPADVQAEAAVYRHIVIAVDSKPPSAAVRGRQRARPAG